VRFETLVPFSNFFIYVAHRLSGLAEVISDGFLEDFLFTPSRARSLALFFSSAVGYIMLFFADSFSILLPFLNLMIDSS